MRRQAIIIVIYIILLISFFFRFWNISSWTYFGLDQEYAAYLMERIVNGVNYPLIGVNVSDTGLYLGPLFLYFGSIWHFLGKGNPVWGSVVASIFGVVNTWLIYHVGQQIFNKKIGQFAALIWTVSISLIIWDKKFWNPMWIPALSLLILLSIYKIEKGENKFIYLTALAVGLGFSSHLQIIVFVPLIIYALFKHWQQLKPYILKALLTFLLLISPLIIFDLSHNFTMSKSLFQQTSRSQVNIALNYQQLTLGVTRFLGVWGQPELTLENSPVASDLSAKTPVSPLSLILLLTGLSLFMTFLKSNQKAGYLFLGVGLSTLFIPVLYKKPLADYYFLYFAPWLVLYIGWMLNYLSRKSTLAVNIIIVLLVFSQGFTFFRSSMDYHFQDKIKAVKFAGNFVVNENFSLNASEGRFRYGGFRYLMSINGATPAKSYIDKELGWLYTYEENFSGDEVYLFPADKVNPVSLPNNPNLIAQFGKIGVAIYPSTRKPRLVKAGMNGFLGLSVRGFGL